MASVYTEGFHTGEFIVGEDIAYRSRDVAIITGGVDLMSGTVLGATDVAATAVATANAGNTGNGTFGTITPTGVVQTGAYQIVMTSATTFTVEGPNGVIVGEGKTGVAFAAGGLGFTLTAGGTAFVVGDGFSIAVTAGTVKYSQLNTAATDGTQTAVAVLYNFAKASVADVKCTIMSRACSVNGLILTWPSGISNTNKAAAIASLSRVGIIVR